MSNRPNPKNTVNLQGRLTKDPEILKGITVACSIAVDYAANDRTANPNTTGFFNFVYFLSDDRDSDFVRKQIESGNMKKGSSVSISGELRQSRWVGTDNATSTGVEVLAHGLTYAGSAERPAGQAAGTAGGGQTVTAPDTF